MPVALSDGFVGPQTWNQYWTNIDAHIVFDTHIYFFVGGSYSYNAAYGACYLAKSYQSSKNPVFIGEWSIQATSFNHLGENTRRDSYRAQLQVYTSYLNGGMFWNGKHDGNAVVGDDGSQQKYYWSWEILASEGIVPKPGDKLRLCAKLLTPQHVDDAQKCACSDLRHPHIGGFWRCCCPCDEDRG